MVNHISTTNEVFTEVNNIQDNVKRFTNYNTYITVEMVRDGYTAGKPTKYTFDNLSLLRMFYSLLANSK